MILFIDPKDILNPNRIEKLGLVYIWKLVKLHVRFPDNQNCLKTPI